MIAMRIYQVIISYEVLSELEAVAQYIASKYVNRILGQLASLSYTADIYPSSRFATAKAVHPNARTISIINHRWTAVFHIKEQYVMIDRIIPSKMMV